jgi:hypothetical protein
MFFLGKNKHFGLHFILWLFSHRLKVPVLESVPDESGPDLRDDPGAKVSRRLQTVVGAVAIAVTMNTKVYLHKQRPILNFTPRGKVAPGVNFVPQGRILSPGGGEVIPWGEILSLPLHSSKQ